MTTFIADWSIQCLPSCSYDFKLSSKQWPLLTHGHLNWQSLPNISIQCRNWGDPKTAILRSRVKVAETSELAAVAKRLARSCFLRVKNFWWQTRRQTSSGRTLLELELFRSCYGCGCDHFYFIFRFGALGNWRQHDLNGSSKQGRRRQLSTHINYYCCSEIGKVLRPRHCLLLPTFLHTSVYPHAFRITPRLISSFPLQRSGRHLLRIYCFLMWEIYCDQCQVLFCWVTQPSLLVGAA